MMVAPAAAQRRATDALTTWIALDPPTGREYFATDLLRRELAGWTRDPLGSLVLRRGSGSPRRVVACALDQPSNAGSAFTRSGARDTPIAWPLRYSHSPAELFDLTDVQSLARPVAALAPN